MKSWILIAAALGFLAVALGAFGAHALKGQLSDAQYGNFQTGIFYQMVHLLAILMIALQTKLNSNLIIWAMRCWGFGILFFSGSLYLLATRDLLPFGQMSWLGPVTPLGGLLFLAGWAIIFISALKHK